MKRSRVLNTLLSTVVTLLLSTSVLAAGDPSVVIHQTVGSYKDVSNKVRENIEDQGLNVTHVLSADDMLPRTGSSFDNKNHIYKEAQTFEFCSTALAHKLAQQTPHNIALCPFTISVYTLFESPSLVNLSYRMPVAKPSSERVIEEAVDLIESIIAESM